MKFLLGICSEIIHVYVYKYKLVKFLFKQFLVNTYRDQVVTRSTSNQKGPVVPKKKKGSKDTGRTIFVPRIAFWPWPCNLNINRGHLLATSIHWTKYSNNQAKVSKDIKRVTFCTQTSSLTLTLTTWPDNQ